MHAFRSDGRAVSEVVGALLLVLIVFSAATSFAVFVNAKQDEYQRHEAFDQDRRLERLEVLHVAPTPNATGDGWSGFTFTIASVHLGPTHLAAIAVNGQSLHTYELRRLNATSGAYEAEVHTAAPEVRLAPRERLELVVDLAAHGHAPIVIGIEDPVTLAIDTWLGNRFTRSFMPPTAIPFVETHPVWDPQADNGTGAFQTILVLDGTRSTAGDGASLVSWSWRILPDNVTARGPLARAAFTQTGITHTIELTVTDVHGFRGTSTIPYVH